MKLFSRSVVAMGGVLVLLSVSAIALAQGYGGVLAPAPSDQKQAIPAAPAGGYSGVIAPPPVKNSDPKKDEKIGYEGLIPGKVVKPEVVKKQPTPVLPPVKEATQKNNKNLKGQYTPTERPVRQSTQFSNPPGRRQAKDSTDLKALSRMYSYDKNGDNIPDSMARDFKLPESTVAFLNVPRPRTEGMLPLESTIKQSIDTALEQMQTNNQRPEEIVDSLKRIRDGLRAKGSVSDGVYKVMGLPDTYVKEEREGVEKSIRRIDDAIRQLGSL